ncbi:hypothetical protein EVJ58_g1132 [Rhodofomes roseus]|uniref:C3H1-type domain-containing protein n=1 Tax=Rhodofomes roseus TaxID=34475 RepID=A0A4Y9Z127_9APHY|nr:hypothetical protein EVJ58_g1132 [Rhodofomes roseus]
MDAPSTSAAALKLEIARLTGRCSVKVVDRVAYLRAGVINRHKTGEPHPQPRPAGRPARGNIYVNPNYKPPSKPAARLQSAPVSRSQPIEQSSNAQKHDVVIGGVTFEASGRSLVRKDLAKSTSSALTRPLPAKSAFIRDKAGTMVNANRTYKPKTSRRIRPAGRNMTLNNSKRPYQNRRVSNKRKYLNKPCPRFTTTGACNRGLTCMYQHDPSKIAICWPFLQGNCPNTAETCPLSHDPTPERTPLCVHFANNGRCTRRNCPFPHVRVGQRVGVCRDFAVLGYCEKGLDCDRQHLPHVIRANRTRKIVPPTVTSTHTDGADVSAGQSSAAAPASSVEPGAGSDASSSHPVTAEDAQLGDEFISLTFHESESEDDEDEESDEDGEDDDEEGEEQSEPHTEPSPSVEDV